MFKARNTDLWGPVPRQISSRNWGEPPRFCALVKCFSYGPKDCLMKQIYIYFKKISILQKISLFFQIRGKKIYFKKISILNRNILKFSRN